MHKTKVVETKVLSDGELAVKVSCCGDESTASWLTIHNVHELDEAGLKSQVEAHKARIEITHEKRNKAHAFVKSL